MTPAEDSLLREDFDALADGTPIVVLWSGGNGPHNYILRWQNGLPYAEWQSSNTPTYMTLGDPMSFVGEYPLTQVWVDHRKSITLNDSEE